VGNVANYTYSLKNMVNMKPLDALKSYIVAALTWAHGTHAMEQSCQNGIAGSTYHGPRKFCRIRL
jgi:hypothetical protein